jgi:thiamine-monophosphate kinase
MDVSDGLIGDLAKMMRASGVSAEVDLDRVPISAAAAPAIEVSPDLLEVALTGGDDYEILCTVPDDRLGAFLGACRVAGTPAAPIGWVVGGTAPPEFRHRGEVWQVRRPSFSHF